MEEEVRYTVTERGAHKLILRGYMYTKHRKVKLGASWRCDFRGECSGRLVVDDDDVVVSSTGHGHDPDWGRCQAQETIAAIKRAAETSRASTSAIVQSKIARVSSETTMKLPKVDSLKRVVRRINRQHLPPEPKSLADLHGLPGRFKKTLEGDHRWLLELELDDEEERRIVFSTNAHLEYLMQAEYWVMDGTFKSAPSIITQIYAIHGKVHEKWVPLVIALMENKTKRSYSALFETLKREVRRRFHRNLSPVRISTDYEQAAISAAQEAFSESEICGCLFHLGQSFWRRLQGTGLAEAYSGESNVQLRADFRSLLDVAYVPVDDVEGAFDELSAVAFPALQPVLTYVSDNYVKGKRRGRGRTRPMFPPPLWNCYTRTQERLPRTTNTCEAWHRRLNTMEENTGVGPSFHLL